MRRTAHGVAHLRIRHVAHCHHRTVAQLASQIVAIFLFAVLVFVQLALANQRPCVRVRAGDKHCLRLDAGSFGDDRAIGVHRLLVDHQIVQRNQNRLIVAAAKRQRRSLQRVKNAGRKALDKITRNFNAKRRGNVHACKASL